MMMKNIILTLLTLISFNVFSQDSITIKQLNTITVLGIRADSKTPITQKNLNKIDLDSTYFGEEIPILLDKTPSITSSSDGGHNQGYTYFRLRGIDQTRINMTLNGVPLNEPEDQGVYTSNFPNFYNSISSFQIQRGVGTSTNGVSSYAGSINYQSNYGLKKNTYAESMVGSWGTFKLNSTYSSGVFNNKSLFINSSYYQSNGFKYNSGGLGYSLFTGGAYYGKKDIFRFTGFIGKSINEMAWLAVSDSLINVDRRINSNTSNENDDFLQGFIQLQHSRQLTNNSTISTSIFYNRLIGNWDLDLKNIYAGDDVLNYQLSSNFGGFLTNYNFNLGNIDLNLGVSVNTYERIHSMGIYPDINLLLYTNSGIKNELSNYLKISYTINKLNVFTDVQYRYTDFKYLGGINLSKKRWNFVNPKFGLTYNQSNVINYYVSIGKSNREPTRTNMFGGNDNLEDISQFIDINPESVVDYELGANISLNDFKIQSNIYYMNFKNEITLLGVLGANGLPLMTNVSKSYRSGIELDFTYKLNNKITFSNTTNLSRNRIVDVLEFEPLFTPNVVINQNIKYTIGGFMLLPSIKYHTKSYINFDNTFVTPAFTTVNLNISYYNAKYCLSLNTTNLTNVNYFTNGYVIDNTPYYFANATRSIYLTFKINL